MFSAHNLPVASILQNLVVAFDKDAKAQNSPYLIKAILRIIVILDDETIRHADSIATKLAQLVDSATRNPADSIHTHFLFETICVLVTKVLYNSALFSKITMFSDEDDRSLPGCPAASSHRGHLSRRH